MKEISTSSGLGGILNAFRDITKESKRITFVGTPGFCTPFAELIAYPVRDAGKEMAFVANLDSNDAKRIVFTSHGMQLAENVDAAADTVVILGGLAMPKISVDVNALNSMIGRILGEGGLTIGVCFMSIFEQTGWYDVIDFDYVIDTHTSVRVLEK
uniref:DUF2124 domain-containing protein n=1 Tax=Candidatus Methanogaster sp. ANME-2c ERB4 TaxID=2759911 RepID=A0A7G9YPI9_9EURY|nr:putative protein MTH_862 [Methanosarcinales archaeon ANME-2c ERB4]